MRLTTADGEELDAVWSEPGEVDRAVVFCHPHPLHRGTMRAPLMEQVTRRLTAAGIAVLRFDFRGVGTSTGAHEDGVGELADIDAAWQEAHNRHPDAVAGIVGWSFGAATSLSWVADRAVETTWVGIAPPLSSDLTPSLPDPIGVPGRRVIIVGDRDQFVTSPDLATYATSVAAEFHTVPGSDHFFYFREDRLAVLVLDGLRR